MSLNYVIGITDQFSNKFDSFEKKLSSVGKKATSIGKQMSLGISAPIAGAALAAGKASIDFESAFTNVIKTVSATDAEITELEKGIREMSKTLPASAVEISNVASSAGQLGIATSNILDFTRVMTDLGNTTNMSADEASTQLARLANVTGMAQTDFDRLGSTIVSLGNNLATTEAEITAMSLRLAGAGSTIGLTEAEILGFAGALSSVGIEAEAGGSAFSKLMVNIASEVATGGDKLATFAKTAGMSAEQFSAAFNDDAGGALITFIEGLGGVQDAGGNVFGVLEDLGMTEVRLRDAMLRASGAGDLFRQSIELGSDAWAENTALAEEAELRYGTTASQLGVLWNRITDVAITLGDVMVPALMNVMDALEPLFTAIEKGAEKFAELDSGTQLLILGAVGLVAVIGPALIVFGMLASAITAISWPVLAAAGAIAVLIAGGVLLYQNFENLSTATKFIIGLIAPLAGLILIGIAIYKNWEEISGWLISIWDKIESAAITVFDAIRTFIEPTITAISDFIHEVFGEVFAWWSENWPLVQETVETVWGAIWEVISFIAKQIWEFLEPTLNTIWNYMKLVWTGIELVIKTVWEAIKLIVRTAIDLVLGIIKIAMQLITGDWKGAWDTMKETVDKVVGNIWTFIKNTFNNGVEFFVKLASRFYEFGSELFDGFKNGIMDAGQRAIDAALAIARRIKDAVAGFFSIKSPSRVMMEMGGFVTDGFAEGMLGGINTAVSAASKLSDMTLGAVSNGSTSSMAPMSAASSGGNVTAVHFHITGEVIDETAFQKFVEKVNRELGRRIGGKH